MSQFLDNPTRARLEAYCRQLCHVAMVKSGARADHLAKFEQVVVKYHARRSATAGTGGATMVTINLHLNNNEEEMVDTLMHEFAHSICAIMYGPGIGHGHRWKSLMLIMGREPKRCHDIDLSETYPDKYRKIVCECGKDHMFSKRNINKVMRGSTYTCQCKRPLVILKAEETQVAARVAVANKAQIITPYQLICACGWFCSVSKRRYNNVLRGQQLVHKKCGGNLKVKS